VFLRPLRGRLLVHGAGNNRSRTCIASARAEHRIADMKKPTLAVLVAVALSAFGSAFAFHGNAGSTIIAHFL